MPYGKSVIGLIIYKAFCVAFTRCCRIDILRDSSLLLFTRESGQEQYVQPSLFQRKQNNDSSFVAFSVAFR